MRSIIKFIIVVGLLVGAVFLFTNQRKKLGSINPKLEYKKAKGYSIEELQHRREKLIRNIQDEL